MTYDALRLDPQHTADVTGGKRLAIAIIHPRELHTYNTPQHGFASFSLSRSLVPTAKGIAANVSDRHNIDFVDTSSGHMIGGVSFEDPHPDGWWNAVHTARALVAIVGDPALFGSALTVGDGFKALATSNATIALFNLAMYRWPDGTEGTKAPGQ